MKNISIVLPAENHNFISDKRVLIPFIQYRRYGFMDRNKNIIVNPKYDFVHDTFRHEKSLVRVGRLISNAYIGTEGKIISYQKQMLGLLDAKGELIVNCEYAGIIVSDDSEYITLRHSIWGHSLIDRHGNTIIPYGVYDYIDGADHNLVRVFVADKTTKEKLWGLVDTSGRVVLPLEYTNIWNFYDKNRRSTTVEKKGISNIVFFDDLLVRDTISKIEDDKYQDDYGTRYGEFAGSYAQAIMGYSDDVINDAFEGDPDAYWNID